MVSIDVMSPCASSPILAPLLSLLFRWRRALSWVVHRMSQSAQLLPLFPLHAVLFPGGCLSLRVFEPRYVSMVSACVRDEAPFGVCLIAAGGEIGEAAVPHAVGTEARVSSVERASDAVFDIVVAGGRRFRLLDHEVEHDLLRGEVEWLPPPPPTPIPSALANLVPLLERVVRDMGERVALPHRFDDAEWVGARYAEILPIPLIARQKLLEMDDVVSRLEIMQKYLDQRGLFDLPAFDPSGFDPSKF